MNRLEPTRTHQKLIRTHREPTRNQPVTHQESTRTTRELTRKGAVYYFYLILCVIFTYFARDKEVEGMSSSQNFEFVSYHFHQPFQVCY